MKSHQHKKKTLFFFTINMSTLLLKIYKVSAQATGFAAPNEITTKKKERKMKTPTGGKYRKTNAVLHVSRKSVKG